MTLRAPAELLYAEALQVLSAWFRIISGNMNAFLSIIGIYWAGCLPAITIFSMRRPGEQGNAHFWPTREGHFSWKIEKSFKGVVKRVPVRVRFQLVSGGPCFCARATQLIYGWRSSRFDREGFSHPEVSYCFREEIGEFLCLDCAARGLLSKWSRWLKTGWWVLFSHLSWRPISFLLCHGLDLFWPSPSLHGLKFLCLSFSIFKDEDSIWKDQSIQWPRNLLL